MFSIELNRKLVQSSVIDFILSVYYSFHTKFYVVFERFFLYEQKTLLYFEDLQLATNTKKFRQLKDE